MLGDARGSIELCMCDHKCGFFVEARSNILNNFTLKTYLAAAASALFYIGDVNLRPKNFRLSLSNY